jgi:flagellar biosynthesis component FlhA
MLDTTKKKEKIDKNVYRVLKPHIILIEHILKVLEKNNFNIFKAKISVNDLSFILQSKLTWNYYYNDGIL